MAKYNSIWEENDPKTIFDRIAEFFKNLISNIRPKSEFEVLSSKKRKGIFNELF